MRFKDFGLHASLIRLHALDDGDLFVLCQEFGLGGRVWEPGSKKDRCYEGQAGNNDHIDLPLSDLDAVVVGLGGSPCYTIRDETGDDLSKTVTSKVPTDALGHFDASIEHLVDEHDTWSDATLCHTEEDTQND